MKRNLRPKWNSAKQDFYRFYDWMEPEHTWCIPMSVGVRTILEHHSIKAQLWEVEVEAVRVSSKTRIIIPSHMIAYSPQVHKYIDAALSVQGTHEHPKSLTKNWNMPQVLSWSTSSVRRNGDSLLAGTYEFEGLQAQLDKPVYVSYRILSRDQWQDSRTLEMQTQTKRWLAGQGRREEYRAFVRDYVAQSATRR